MNCVINLAGFFIIGTITFFIGIKAQFLNLSKFFWNSNQYKVMDDQFLVIFHIVFYAKWRDRYVTIVLSKMCKSLDYMNFSHNFFLDITFWYSYRTLYALSKVDCRKQF